MALANATLPYVLEIVDRGWRECARRDRAPMERLDLLNGRVTHRAGAFGIDVTPAESVL